MKRGIKDIIGKSIVTTDGTKARIKDFLFDHKTWIIRYLEADFGNLFKNKRVLIPRLLLKESIMDKDDDLLLSVSMDVIEVCPEPESDLPISRQYEEQLNHHYGIDNYWSFAPMMPGYGVAGPIYPVRVPPTDLDENELNKNSLRSFNEVNGYSIRAIDDTLGSIDNMIMDDSSWQIEYMVVDTNNWLPWSKKVLIGISLLENIHYANKEAEINLSIETIKSAPDFDESRSVDMNYENALHDYYERISVH